jgi:importin subunit alpha-1
MHGEWEVRKEAIWTLSNIATGGSPVQVMSVVEVGAIESLCSILNVNDSKMLLVALDAIESILKVGASNNKDYNSFVDECDGLMAIEELQQAESEEVYEKAVHIIETYFGVEDEMEDENLAPVNNGNMFSFGVQSKDIDIAADPSQGTQMFNFAI